MDRRAVILTALGAATGSVRAQTRSAREILAPLGDGQAFSFDALLAMARELSRLPHVPVSTDLPAPFANLTYDQYLDIRAKPSAHLFSEPDYGSSVELLHRGFLFVQPVQIAVVEGETIRQITYDSNDFSFGRAPIQQRIEDIGFSGIRIFGDRQRGAKRQVAIMQGATFFRSAARGQTLGVMSRILALRVAEARGEEVPAIRSLWIVKPQRGETSLTIYALVASPSLTGVWRATFRPGETTIVDAQVTLFARTAIDHLGLGPMSTTFLHGPLSRRNIDDYRPAVHESSGLQMLTGKGEWLWRPLSNRTNLQISAFVDENPRGFGFLQRDRAFASFEDADQNFELRPSLWVEPIGDWGTGAVSLIEIPTDSDVNDNVIAYWRPRTPLGAGQEATFAYRQFWCWTPPEKPALAISSGARSGRAVSGRRRRFVVDFEGDVFADPGRIVEMKPVLTVDRGTVSNLQMMPFPERKTCRVSFELDPAAETQCELRLVVEAGGAPVSETWLYRWTQ